MPHFCLLTCTKWIPETSFSYDTPHIMCYHVLTNLGTMLPTIQTADCLEVPTLPLEFLKSAVSNFLHALLFYTY